MELSLCFRALKSRARYRPAQDNDTCMLTWTYRSFVGVYGCPRSLSPSVLLMHQVSGICLLLFGKEKYFQNLPTRSWSCGVLANLAKLCIIFWEICRFFFGFLKRVWKGCFMKLRNGGVELPLSRARLQVFAWWRTK
jgi:hypothetical protein